MADESKEESPEESQQKPENAAVIKVDQDWQTRREARVVMNCLFRRKARIQFGLLEQLNPSLSSLPAKTPTNYHCKLLLYGKAGVGKTSTVLKLCGRNVPAAHLETLGLQTSVTYWPVRLLPRPSTTTAMADQQCDDEMAILKIDFWDAGERSIRKFDHILSSMISSTDTIAFFFSFTDRSSWNELPLMIKRIPGGKADSHLKVVIGTRRDCAPLKVTEEEISSFEKKYGIRVLTISNVNGALLANGQPNGQAELSDIMPLMNQLTELVMNNRSPVT